MDKQGIANISVVIPTYNRYPILVKLIENLWKQNPRPLEIIVIDQTENQEALKEKFLKKLIKENIIRYIYQSKVSANIARNRGIKEAKGEIVLILNDDVIIPEDFIKNHMKNFFDFLIVAVSGAVIEDDSGFTDIIPLRYYRKFTGWMYFPLNFSKRTEVINLNACNMSVRRDVILRVGGFDENFTHTYFDDTDLSLRIHRLCKKKGFKTVHDPAPYLIHLKLPGGKRPSGLNEYVVADRYAWRTWLYFFIIDFYIIFVLHEVFWRIRACILRKKNFQKPVYFFIAVWEFLLGLGGAIFFVLRGRRLGLKDIN
ncbi:MAG: glycosyltransferase family 2 protein [Candidatus Omnitrophica bacterium]|nr:glycosyltransferase family 2 protein [Candidatus Omnitrophota bacterium]